MVRNYHSTWIRTYSDDFPRHLSAISYRTTKLVTRHKYFFEKINTLFGCHRGTYYKDN